MPLSIKTLNQEDIRYFAALDIGSNSFHFILARQVAEHVQILHSEKYKVSLASGLDDKNKLSHHAIMRGIATLASLVSSTSQLSVDNFRAVATFTLRQASNANEFLSVAKQVFPFDIEVISGHEEARLIYCGVNYHSASSKQRLVLDIGGGSTECIIGQQENILALASLTMGCVSFTQAYFSDQKITKALFSQAITAAKAVIEPMTKRYKKIAWQKVIGTSGTIKAIYQVVNYNQHIKQAITVKRLQILQHELINCNHIDNIDIAGLKPGRNEVICAGVAILAALMESLNIEKIDYCKYALREGVLFEQMQNISPDNTRKRTINSLITRFNVDSKQTALVNSIAEHIFNGVNTTWEFDKAIYQELLISAIELHEIGFDINSSGYHRHGQYILSHADLAGFNQEQQQALAWLVGNQRKNLTPTTNELWHVLRPKLLIKLVAILRLSIILSQQRILVSDYLPLVTVSKDVLILHFKLQWLAERPLIDRALHNEKEKWLKHGIKLSIQYQDNLHF